MKQLVVLNISDLSINICKPRFLAKCLVSYCNCMNNEVRYFGFKYNLDRSTAHLKFDPTGIQTHDLQIMDSPFHVPAMPF